MATSRSRITSAEGGRPMSTQPKGLTYYDHALAQVELEAQGRFAAGTPTVTPGPVPRQPEGSPFAADLVGQEPPLGLSVDWLPPVGEVHELSASAGQLLPAGQEPGLGEPLARGGGVAPAVASPPFVSLPAHPGTDAGTGHPVESLADGTAQPCEERRA